MKKFLIILIIIFICGVLSADTCLKQMKESDVLLGIEFYEQYANEGLKFKYVFWNIFYERMKALVLVLLLCFTPLKERLGSIIALGFSFFWGFYCMSCIVELGVAGLVVGLASVIPHGLLYASGIALLLSKRREKRLHYKNNSVMHVVQYMILILLFVTACVIESLVGIHFIPWVIRLSFI